MVRRGWLVVAIGSGSSSGGVCDRGEAVARIGVPVPMIAAVCGENSGVALNFRGSDRDQPFLMPPSLSEWLAEDHLAYFIVDVVDELDLSAFQAVAPCGVAS